MSHLNRLQHKAPAATATGQEKKKEKHMTEFADPGSSVGIEWGDLSGSLLLIDVSSLETEIETTFGKKDAIRADVTVLDGDLKDAFYGDAMIFPRALIGQLRGQVGKKVLGRLTQGNAKPGQKPPWLLAAADDKDRKVAAAALIASATDGGVPF